MQIQESIPRFKRSGPSSPGENCRIAVLGLGNILFSDEGIGVHAAAALSKQFTFSPAVDIMDGGTMGLDLLPFFQDRERILIIDAVDFGKPAGYMACLNQSDIRAVLNPKLSAHHIGLADLLFATRLTRALPLDLCLIGIQPQSLALGIRMSDLIMHSLDALVAKAIVKLEEWKVEISKAAQPIGNEALKKNIFALPPAVLY